MNISATGSTLMAAAARTGGMRPPGPPPSTAEVFSRIDGNTDGSVTLDELKTFTEAINARGDADLDAADMLATLDTDGDGVVSEEEGVEGLDQFRPEPPAASSGAPMGSLLESCGGDSQSLIELLNNLAETGTSQAAKASQTLLTLLTAYQESGSGQALDLSA